MPFSKIKLPAVACAADEVGWNPLQVQALSCVGSRFHGGSQVLEDPKSALSPKIVWAKVVWANLWAEGILWILCGL